MHFNVVEVSVPENRNTLEGRLRWAIEDQPWDGKRRGVRLFQRRMEERAKKLGLSRLGVGVTSIGAYLRGDRTPSSKFLSEAATVLGVRPEWLILGKGAPTEADEVLAEAAAARRAVDDPTQPEMGPAGTALVSTHRSKMDRIEQAFMTGASTALPLRDPLTYFSAGGPRPDPALVVLLALWRERYRRWHPIISERALEAPDEPRAWEKAREELEVELAEEIGAAIAAPLLAFRMDLELLSEEFLTEYILALSPVLRRVIEQEPQSGRSARAENS